MPGPSLQGVKSSWRRFRFEWLFLLAGLLLLGRSASGLLTYLHFQRSALQSYGHGPARTAAFSLQPGSLQRLGGEHRVIATVGVPRLGMAVAVVEGVDDDALGIAAGHMPGTAAFGQLGNAVIAAHRDLGFHPLRRVRLGDLIEVNSDRPYRYRVDRIQVVNPDAVEVLTSSTNATLTLITCYPFGFIGTAPQRFVVHATLLTQA